VLFTNFGESSLDFDARVFIDDINWVAFVASDLRFSIHKALSEAGIEIPFPQRDIHVKGLDQTVDKLVSSGTSGGAKRGRGPGRNKGAEETGV
jgi:small-conductance mechanosensitive channel